MASRIRTLAMIPRRTSQTLERISRSFAAAASATSSSTQQGYVSPFQDIFDQINEGRTFLGTEKFVKPEQKYLGCGVPESALRFKTSSYGRFQQAPFVSPNEHRVTLQVATDDIPLNPKEMALLKEIVGTRLCDERSILQLSSIQFGSRIENKRHVVTMLDRCVESARTLAKRLDEYEGNTSNTTAAA